MIASQRRAATSAGRTLALLVGVIALPGCASGVYDQEVAGFSTGADAVVASYWTGRRAVDADVVRQQQAADAVARTRLLLLPGCNQTDPSTTPPTLPDCAVVAFGAQAAPPPSDEQRRLADAAAAFGALRVYATALAAVTASVDATALNLAIQRLATAAGGLAGEVGQPRANASLAGALVAPVGGLLAQGITLWLDQRRAAALRNAVLAVDPDVQVLGQTLQAALAAIRARRVLQLGADLRGAAASLEVPAVSHLSAASYASQRAVLQASIAAFNQARAADPARAIAAMASAHRQLALALAPHADSAQAAAALTAVQAFVTAAQSLQTATAGAAAAAQ